MKIRWVLVVGLVSLVMVACADRQATPQNSQSSPIRVGWSNWPGYYPLAIGVEKGFFEEHGVLVEPTLIEGQTSSAFLTGKFDAVLDTIADSIQMNNYQPDNIRILLPVDYSDGGDAFLSVAEIDDLATLEGQTLGTLNSPFSLVFATAMLQEHGLSLRSVDQIKYRVVEGLDLLASNQVHTIHTYEPYLSQGVEQGYHVIYSSKDTPGLIVDVLNFRTEFIEQHPEDVQAFVDGWYEAVDWWQAHPEEGNAIMADYFEVPVDEISTTGVAILNQEDALQLVGADSDQVSPLYETAELYIDVMANLGMLKTYPDLDSLIDSSFIK